MIRKVDELGRVVLPEEMRQALGIAKESEVSITLTEKTILIESAENRCDACGKIKQRLIPFGNISVCDDCLDTLKEI